MARQVITQRDVDDAKARRDSAGSLAAGGGLKVPNADEYSDRLIKYIPGEVVSVYLFVSGLLATAKGQIPPATFWWLQWGVFGFLLIMTPVYLHYVQDVKKKLQLLITFGSFAVWVFTLGGPFAQLSWYHPIYGAVLLPLYTFSIAIVKAKR